MFNPSIGARVNPYAAARSASATSPAAAPAAPAATAETTSAAASREGLSAAEQGMIDRYFPDSPSMALRLYGPGGTRTAYPAAVGGRLDLLG